MLVKMNELLSFSELKEIIDIQFEFGRPKTDQTEENITLKLVM